MSRQKHLFPIARIIATTAVLSCALLLSLPSRADDRRQEPVVSSEPLSAEQIEVYRAGGWPAGGPHFETKENAEGGPGLRSAAELTWGLFSVTPGIGGRG